MKKVVLIFLCLLCYGFLYAQKPSTGIDLEKYRLDDDATSFMYACLDSFLDNPEAEKLYLFENCEKALWRELKSSEEFTAWVILMCNKGYYMALSGNIYVAIDAYENAWKTYKDQQLQDFDIIEYCLKPLGNYYTMLGDYNSAEHIIKNYMHMSRDDQHISAIINLSIVYNCTKRYQQAIQLLNEGIKQNKTDSRRNGLLHSNLAINYLSVNEIENAEICIEKAIHILKREEISVELLKAWETRSLIYQKKGDAKSALEILKNIHNHLDLFPPREKAKLYIQQAKILQDLHRYAESLNNYSLALQAVLPDYLPQIVTELPDPDMFYSENALKEALDGMAGVFIQTGKLQKAIDSYTLSFDVEEKLRETYNYQDAKFYQQEENRSRTENVLNLLNTLFEQNGDRQYLIKAFEAAERTKAVVLKENIQKKYLQQRYKNEPLQQTENKLKAKKAWLENALIQEQLKGQQSDTSLVNNLIGQQNDITLALKQVTEQLEEKYGHYIHSQSTTTQWDINTIQKKLKKNNSILMEYFSGNNYIFVFTIGSDFVDVHKIDSVSGIQSKMDAFTNLFSDPSKINNELQTYTSLACSLFKELHIPLSDDPSTNLIIIPDGRLNFLPFEALLFEPSNGIYYEHLPYLIKKYIISYQPSAVIYLRHTDKKVKPSPHILGVFPVFENSNKELRYSLEEANYLKSHFKGDFFYHDKATKNTFINQNNQYDIIHLSTHANADDTLKPPSIGFIDSTLYLPEIYGLQFDAELIVLSACETGIGNLHKGEGPASLSQGFQYAGIQNLIFSLWKVNDHATSLLMSDFYKSYSDHQNKARALHQAKIDYLSNKDIPNSNKSPYFWAAFVYYGETDIYSTTWYIPYAIGLIIVVILGIFLVIFFRKEIK